MKDPSSPYRWMLLVTSLMTLGYLAAALAQENYLADWQVLQRKYRAILEEKATDQLGRELLKNFRIELRQVSLPGLNAVDRCVTCHVGIDDPRMTDVPQPFRLHPGDPLRHHSVDRFGCTVCHEGQGAASTYRDAAHKPLPFWDSPMLKGEFLQAGCGKCHQTPVVPQAPLLELGRLLYREEFACDTCHGIHGEGGYECPELTYVGSKPLRAFDFTHVKGARTREHWLFEHFKDPEAVVPGSQMPNQELTDAQALALTILMLSLTDDVPPFDYIVRQPAPRFGAGQAELAALVEEEGCLLCHSLKDRGAQLAPDLANLTGERNADWLFQHFKDPAPALPSSNITPFRLSDAEANHLTRYVLSLK